MAIYIEGMEMPPGGRILIVFPSGRVLEVSADATQDIFRETQAVPVPSHGRLIDADALDSSETDYLGNHLVYLVDIDAAPTIIPASERKMK